MKQQKHRTKIFSFVLSVLMLLGVPLPAFAQAAVENAIEEAQNQPVLMTDKLTETETYWQNADGSITYESHLEPIRYQDEAGSWHEIVNDVVQVDKSVESTDAFKEEPYDYRSESSKSWVLLDEDIRSDAPIKIQRGAYSLAVKPLWNQDAQPQPTQEDPATPAPTQEPAGQTPEATPSPTLTEEQPTQTPAPTQQPQAQEATQGRNAKYTVSTQENVPKATGDAPPEQNLPESRLSFNIKTETEQPDTPGKKTVQRAKAKKANAPYDPYTYSPELEYESVDYSNVFEEGVSLRLQPNNIGMKEDIILTEAPKSTAFSFELSVEGVVLELTGEDGVVLIKDSETLENIGFIPQPFMVDSGVQEEYENISFDIGVALEDMGNGQYLYTLTPSQAYLQDENTVYPVKIDPSVNIDGATKTKDTYVDSSHPNSNYYTNQYLRVGHDTAGAKFRSIMSFDLPSGLDKAYISEATVNTYQSYNGTSTPMFGMYRVKIPWESNNLTWNNVTAYLELDGKYAEGRVGNTGWYTWPATNLARAWSVKGNYGLLFKSEEEGSQRYKRWYSSDSSICKPILTLLYTPSDTATTVRVYPGGNNTSKGDIKVNWNPQTGVKIRAYLDGKPVEASGDSYTWHDVVSGVEHKVKVEFYTDYGVKVFSEEKTAKIPDNSPPVFSDIANAYMENGEAVLSFAPAFKPGSIENVAFATRAEGSGVIWHSKDVVGTTTGTWATTIDINSHGNGKEGYLCHLYATTDKGATLHFGTVDFNFTEESEKIGENVDISTSGPVAGKIQYKKISDTKFTITAERTTRRDAIAKHEIYWSEVGSDEKHLLETLNGYLGSEATRRYNIEESGLPSGKSIYFTIKAYDDNGNYTTMELPTNVVDIPNHNTPQRPSDLSVINGQGESYLYDQTPAFGVDSFAEVHWKVEKGLESEFDIAHIQYRIDDGAWETIDPSAMIYPDRPIKDNGYRIPLASQLAEGEHIFEVRAVDGNTAHQLAGPARSITVVRDTTAPALNIAYPSSEGDPPVWAMTDQIVIQDVQDAFLDTVTAEIGIKLPWELPLLSAAYQTVPIQYTKDENGKDTFPATVSLTGLDLVDGQYAVRIKATDKAGHSTVREQAFTLITDENVQGANRQLVWASDHQRREDGTYWIDNRNNTFTFNVLGEVPEGAYGKLFVGGEFFARDDGIENGQVEFTLDVLDDLSTQRRFGEGSTTNLHAVLYDANDNPILYSQPLYIKDNAIAMTPENLEMEELKGFTQTGQSLTHAGPLPADNQFVLKRIDSVYGMLESVEVAPAEAMPENLKFEVSFYDDSGAYFGKTVVAPGETAAPQFSKEEIAGTACGYVLRGYIEQPGETPYEIDLSQLHITERYVGTNDLVYTQLVDPPTNLSATPLLNYTTWLRWTPAQAEGAEQIQYEIFRQTVGMQDQKCIAVVEEPYYYDYNLSYGETFEYWVVAHATYPAADDAADVRSLPTNSATAAMVDQGEVDKYLGLQDYWSYLTADMGNGTGYINTASGNLVYQKTDFTNTAPLLASTMRRTFNSQATSNSPLGKGWDFSFNTNMLAEMGHDESGQPITVALLLKDGDGTVHRYEKQPDGTYKAPSGIFITLEEQADGTFKAARSDDIVYTFNQSMFIESFSEPNGNKLLFEYDERGRLIQVMHSLYQEEGFAEEEKQYITFEYGSSPHDQDKIIKANNIYGSANGELVQQSYLYTYFDDPAQENYGQLKDVRTSVVRPIKTLQQRPVSGGGGGGVTESIEDSQETVTMFESYEYPGESSDAFVIVSPANEMSAAGSAKQSALTLDEANRVSLFTNANGDTSALAYAMLDENRQQTTVTNTVDGSGAGCTSYITDLSNHGVAVQTISPNGRKTYYENYTDTLKAQTIRTYRDAAETVPVAYAITYDELGNALTVLAPDGVLTTNTYAAGKDWLTSQTLTKGGAVLNKIVYTYDDKGNQLSATTAVSDPASFTDTKTTRYTYDGRGQMTSQTAWNGQQTRYAYDKFGRLSESTVSGSGISQTTRYTYDAYNHPATTTSERGSSDITTETQYDALGYLLKTVHPTGLVEAYRYNANGLQTEQLMIGYTEGGQFVEAKKTTVQYDEINRAAAITDPKGTVQTQAVSAGDGLITTQTETMGTDGVLRQSSVQTAVDGSYATETSQGLGSKTYYDYIGNMSRVTQIHGGTEERGVNASYDVMGQLIHTWDDTNTVESYTDYDALGHVQREWTYVKTDGETRLYTVKQYTHDLQGQVTSVREYTNLLPYGAIAETEPYQTTSYTYDESAGEGLTKNTVTDAEGGVTETYYNQMGQVVKEVQKGRSSEKQIVTVYAYDGYGRQTVVKQGDQNTQTVKQSYEYDAYDRVKKQKTNGSTYTELTYDHFGRRDGMTDHTDGETIQSSWAYDKNDRALFVMQDGKIMGFGYNGVGEMTSIRYSAGNTMEIEGAVRTATYDYDDLGRLTAVKSGVVDTNNQTLAENVKTVKDYRYAANGDLTESREYLEFDTKEDKQGVTLTQSYVYDAVGRPTEVAYKQGEAVKEKYTQRYDGRNYITEGSYTDGYGDTAKTLNRTYAYDAIGRLTETGVSNSEKTKTTGYQYDKVGNRLYQTVEDGTKTVSTKYTYNALGQLTQTQKGLGTADSVASWLNEEVYTYDMYGNQTGVEVYEINEEVTSSEKAGDVRYTYDESNQMVQYETKGVEETEWTQAARNVYNGEGMRIRQYENGNDWARQYFYIGGALAISTDGSNENFVKSENILDPSGTILAARREAKDGEQIEGSAYWVYHYDAQGSATNLVGVKDGTLYRAEENVYDAFGNEETGMKEPVSSVQNDIKFTGATLDNSGTYYLGSRHYDPNTGRFLQQDTFKGDVYSPWTQNLYTYTSNNPVNYVDPTGHSLLGIITGIAGFVAATITAIITAPIVEKVVGGVVNSVSKAVSNVSNWVRDQQASVQRYFQTELTTHLAEQWKEEALANERIRTRQGKLLDISDRLAEKSIETNQEPFAVPQIKDTTKKQGKYQIVYRVYGGISGPYGRSWTPVNPTILSKSDYAEQAGLPKNNTMEYIAIGVLVDDSMVEKKMADSLDGHRGGWPEYLFPSEESVKENIIFRQDIETEEYWK